MSYQPLLRYPPYAISTLYLAFGVVWVGTTDWLVITFVQSPETVALLQAAKGWIFVGLSTLLIFGLTTARQTRIERAQERLERVTEQLQVMNRVFRHNIRNDITVIQGYIEVVQEQLRDSQKQAQLGTAHQTAAKIVSISEKIQVVNKINPNSISEDSEVDLVDLAVTEVQNARAAYPEATITVAVPDHAFVRGEPHLRYAIRETLENAIVHNTKPEAQRAVHLEITRENGTTALSIEDNGPSIDQEELVPLRTKEETELVHMSGIGLWLTMWLTEYYGGDLQIDTEGNSGTTVTFNFEPPSQIPLLEETSRAVKDIAPTATA